MYSSYNSPVSMALIGPVLHVLCQVILVVAWPQQFAQNETNLFPLLSHAELAFKHRINVTAQAQVAQW